jgi:hypothetical protein
MRDPVIEKKKDKSKEVRPMPLARFSAAQRRKPASTARGTQEDPLGLFPSPSGPAVAARALLLIGSSAYQPCAPPLTRLPPPICDLQDKAKKADKPEKDKSEKKGALLWPGGRGRLPSLCS